MSDGDNVKYFNFSKPAREVVQLFCAVFCTKKCAHLVYNSLTFREIRKRKTRLYFYRARLKVISGQRNNGFNLPVNSYFSSQKFRGLNSSVIVIMRFEMGAWRALDGNILVAKRLYLHLSAHFHARAPLINSCGGVEGHAGYSEPNAYWNWMVVGKPVLKPGPQLKRSNYECICSVGN